MEEVKVRHLLVPGVLIAGIVYAAACCIGGGGPTSLPAEPSRGAVAAVVAVLPAPAAADSPSAEIGQLTRRREELLRARDAIALQLAQCEQEKSELDAQLADLEQQLAAKSADPDAADPDADPDDGEHASKTGNSAPFFLEAMRAANHHSDAAGYLDGLRDELLATHPFLEGVSKEDFGERTLVALRRVVVEEPQLVLRGGIDVAALARAFEWDALVGSWFEPGQGDADPQVDARLDLAASALVEAVADPFTRRVRGDHAFNLTHLLDAQFPSEVGLLLDRDARGVFIRDVVRDTDAAAKGVRAGDRVLAIAGESTADVPLRRLEQAVARPCKMTLTRDGFAAPVDLELFAFDPTQMGVRACKVAPEVGYLSFGMFGGQAFGGIAAESRRLIKEGARALVLDLRGNPGGLIAEAVAIANLFLPPGVEVTEIVQREGREELPDTFWSATPAFGPELPLVVLIDRCSASASEMLAGALQANHRALLVGEPTFGKGIGQTMHPLLLSSGESPSDLPRMDVLWITSLRFLSPGGRDHHGVGIPPDLVAPRPPDTRSRMVARAAWLGDAALLERISVLELDAAACTALRTPGPPPAALVAAAGAPVPDADAGEALKDVARLVLAARHPELQACPDLDPALAKAVIAAQLALKRIAAK